MIKRKMLSSFKLLTKYFSQKGQTSVEYILLLAVIAVISSGLFSKIEQYIVSNPDSILNSYMSGLSGVFGDSGSGQFKYKRFILRR